MSAGRTLASMSALTDTLAARTSLDDAQVDHIARLVGEWQLLADLAFADLLPVGDPCRRGGQRPGFLCVAQCRPTTGPTAYQHDQVGVCLRGARVDAAAHRATPRPASSARSTRTGTATCRSGARRSRSSTTAPVIAVIGRDANLASVRTPSQLELVYLQSAADLAAMVADGTFPAADSQSEEGAGPRVGDGLVRLEPDGTIIYASPNALSAFSRLGVTGNVLSEPIDALTSTVADDPFDASDLAGGRAGHRRRAPAGIEVEGGGATILFRALPLRPRGRDARRAAAHAGRHRAAPPRPPDHEQGRDDPRDPPPGEEQPADRRGTAAAAGPPGGAARGPSGAGGVDAPGQSIALVHETLSVSIDEAVDFDEIVDRLLVMLADVMGSAGRLRIAAHRQVRRDPGRGRDRAGPGADRAGAERDRARVPGQRRRIKVARRGRCPASAGQLTVTIIDDGVGLPDEFTPDTRGPARACRSSARWSRPSSTARSS